MRRLSVLACCVAVGCGGDGPGSPEELLDQLNALPGVTATEQPTDRDDYSYLVVQFTQPVDHAAPDGQTFQQQVSLLHRDGDAPMVVLTTGYHDYYLDTPGELASLLGANQISIEHRFFAGSRPDPADWTKLTIQQMADDQHVIIQALRTIYPGAFISTGGSKGGMTAVYHRRFYPDDVDGTVPYVAPMTFGAPDPRYVPFLDTVGTTECREAVRAVAIELLSKRRDAMVARADAQPGHSYTRIALPAAVEGSIVALEWTFWQYYGITRCDDVPATTASDEQLFAFLDTVAPIGDNDDEQLALFEPYYFQSYAQLGYPDGGAAYLDPFLLFGDQDYEGVLPVPEPPPFDGGAAMQDIDAFVQTQGDRLLFIYGEWDPWTAGRFELGQATDSLSLTQAEGTHGARIGRLAVADGEAALAKIAAWTGVLPANPFRRAALSRPVAGPEPDAPRVPPAMLRAGRALRAAR